MEFKSMKWVLKYKRGKHTIDEIVAKGKMFEKDIKGEHFDEDEIVYWETNFPEYMRNYLRDYPNCKPISEYVDRLEKRTLDDIDSVVEIGSSSSNKKTKYTNEIILDDIENNSSIEIDDSDYEIDV
jgi:hypothetical protein